MYCSLTSCLLLDNEDVYSSCSGALARAGYLFSSNMRGSGTCLNRTSSYVSTTGTSVSSGTTDTTTTTTTATINKPIYCSRDASGFLHSTTMPPYDALLYRAHQTVLRRETNDLQDTSSQQQNNLTINNKINARSDKDSSESLLQLEVLEEDSFKRSLSRVIDVLSTSLFTSQERLHTIGCVHALTELSRAYPPVVYPSPWGACESVSSTTPPPVTGLLLQVMSVDGSTDLPLHSDLLTLTCNLLSGVAVSHLHSAPVSVFSSALPMPITGNASVFFTTLGTPKCRALASRTLVHITRVLSVYCHVLEGIQPGVKQQQQTSNSDGASPLKRRTKQDGASADGEKKYIYIVSVVLLFTTL